VVSLIVQSWLLSTPFYLVLWPRLWALVHP
jgi:hypothetical protein